MSLVRELITSELVRYIELEPHAFKHSRRDLTVTPIMSMLSTV